jgi:E3 ubiquitin-protein ligase RNF13
MIAILLVLFVSTRALVISDSVYQHQDAVFGSQQDLEAPLFVADFNLCDASITGNVTGSIILVERGDCPFVDKAMRAQDLGCAGIIIGNSEQGGDDLLRMGPTNETASDAVKIHCVFISHTDLQLIRNLAKVRSSLMAAINEIGRVDTSAPSKESAGFQALVYLLILVPISWCVAGMIMGLRKCIANYAGRWLRRRRVTIPTVRFNSNGAPEPGLVINDACAICLDDFTDGTSIKKLPCHHGFHAPCIGPWLEQRSDLCPMCKQSIITMNEPTCTEWICLRVAGVTPSPVTSPATSPAPVSSPAPVPEPPTGTLDSPTTPLAIEMHGRRSSVDLSSNV